MNTSLSDSLKIKVNLADRVYPLNILRDEEEVIRKAARRIGEMLKKYEEGYAVRDKQDLLAMCALQLASRLEKLESQDLVDGGQVANALQKLEDKIQAALN